jgi:cell division transport system ATP-binding protein
LIEFENVGFARGPAEILRAVTLSLEPGLVHLVLGEPGAGKSTLIGLCHGGLRPTRGMVRHFGQPLPRGRDGVAALRRRIGVVERGAGFVPHLSLRDNIAVPLVAAGGCPDGRDEDIAALIAWTGLGGRAGLPPRALAAAERQRAAVARAVILDPAVIVADDPAAGLAPDEAEALMALFVDLGRMGRTVLIATGAPELAAWVAARTEVRAWRLAAGALEAA